MTIAPSLERNPDLVVAATYRRDVAASLDGVWENVLDWEHLPWLHAATFREVALVAEGTWGWRARVALARGGEVELELIVDRVADCYVARTVSGMGVGTEIWTRLGPGPAGTIRVEIDFCLPSMISTAREALGRGYVEMYERLWNEDEGMIQHREEALRRRRNPANRRPASPRSLSLGDEEQVRARLPIDFELAGQRFRLVERAGKLVAHASECPHRLGPLADCPVSDGTLVCPWHGYRFDATSGRERTGHELRLARAPRIERDPATGFVWAHVDSSPRGLRGFNGEQ